MAPWLTIPPDSWRAWVRLAVWEVWIGMLVCAALGFGLKQILSAPSHVVTIYDFTNCYAATLVQPCERVVYRTGGLNVVFTVMSGVLLLLAAAWLLWELWIAVKPRPIADDFLKLLHDSFARDWRNPLTWPWTRLLWAYGFALAGASTLAGVGLVVWTLAWSSGLIKPPAAQVETSQHFRLDQPR